MEKRLVKLLKIYIYLSQNVMNNRERKAWNTVDSMYSCRPLVYRKVTSCRRHTYNTYKTEQHKCEKWKSRQFI